MRGILTKNTIVAFGFTSERNLLLVFVQNSAKHRWRREIVMAKIFAGSSMQIQIHVENSCIRDATGIEIIISHRRIVRTLVKDMKVSV
jgi:hypothetical protein